MPGECGAEIVGDHRQLRVGIGCRQLRQLFEALVGHLWQLGHRRIAVAVDTSYRAQLWVRDRVTR
jgi:hypothetical protein